MSTGRIEISSDLLDALVKCGCPAVYKELVLAIMRYTYGYEESERAVSVSCLARSLSQDRSNTARRLRVLIATKVVKETVSFTQTEARRIKINTEYSEWLWGGSELASIKELEEEAEAETKASGALDDSNAFESGAAEVSNDFGQAEAGGDERGGTGEKKRPVKNSEAARKNSVRRSEAGYSIQEALRKLRVQNQSFHQNQYLRSKENGKARIFRRSKSHSRNH